jgi:uncharacterized oxidoreductase
MINLSAEELRDRVREVFVAADCPQPVAWRVADSLVENNLVGHDSHGVIRVPAYVHAVQRGRIDPQGEVRVVRESAGTALLDCGLNFGQVGANRGIKLAVEKAAQHDTATVVLQNCGHTGRLGEYVVQAAEQGYMALMVCNGPSARGIVAPYGGIGRALGANPIAWAVPGPNGDAFYGGKPIFLDYATSVCAQGKIQVAADKGQLLPEGCLLDKQGRPTRDPNEQFRGGIMLPFGLHKGYALSILVEILGGGLSGSRPVMLRDQEYDQGTMFVVTRIEAFQPLDEFRSVVGEFVERIKEIPRAEGVDEILVPGEPEWRARAERSEGGVPLPEKTWERIREVAGELGLSWGVS